jgi:hypothetical protein
LANIIPPSRMTLAFLMLFVGMTPDGFCITETFRTTMSYNILVMLSAPLSLIEPILLEYIMN